MRSRTLSVHSRAILSFDLRCPLLALAMAILIGCHRDMRDQHRAEANEASRFFADGRADRPFETGVIPRGQRVGEDLYLTGRQDGTLTPISPVTPSRAVLERGRERFNIYCAPCHDRTGEGRGMIVQRGYNRPPTLHSPRLRAMPDGHFFEVISAGFGTMPSYRGQIPTADRWAIVAYLRALQLSQHAPYDSLSSADQILLESQVMEGGDHVGGN